MGRRNIIVLDEKLTTKLRKIQSEQIRRLSKSISFSKIINDTLEIDLKWIFCYELKRR